jgi:hypothetical protein
MKMHRHLDCLRIYDSILHHHDENAFYNTLEHMIYRKNIYHDEGLGSNFYWLLIMFSFIWNPFCAYYIIELSIEYFSK